MISRYKRKKIVDFLVDGKNAWEIARILRIDYKTAKKYCDQFRPEIEKAGKMLSNLKFDENRSILDRIPVIKNIFGGKDEPGTAKQAERPELDTTS